MGIVKKRFCAFLLLFPTLSQMISPAATAGTLPEPEPEVLYDEAQALSDGLLSEPENTPQPELEEAPPVSESEPETAPAPVTRLPWSFTDVPTDSVYYTAVYSLWEQNLLPEQCYTSLYHASYFKPDAPLTALDAASLVLPAFLQSKGQTTEVLPDQCLQTAIGYELLPPEIKEETAIDCEAMLVLLHQLSVPLEPVRDLRTIPGLLHDEPYYQEILFLYRAGVYSGTDTYGTFDRHAAMTRGQFAQALAALMKAELRDTKPLQFQTGMEAFQPEGSAENPFTDISADAWYAASVHTLYELGLVNGVTETVYSPSSQISAIQFLVMAVRVHERYHGKTTDFTAPAGQPWYTTYLAKAKEYGILPGIVKDISQPVTRRQAFAILYRTLPLAELAKIRTVCRLPDLSQADPQYQEIITLYEAGITSGSDQFGTCRDGQPITRAESAALLCRLIQPETRSSAPVQYQSGMEVFQPIPVQYPKQFGDIAANAPYAESVNALFQLGLVNGTTKTAFAPVAQTTLAEATVIAMRVYEYYHGLSTSHTDLAWFGGYAALAQQYGIVDKSWTDYSANATREQIAYLLYHCLPAGGLAEKNKVRSLPDVKTDYRYANEILGLCRAGVLSCEDEYGTFSTGKPVTRAEYTMMLERLLYPEKRLAFSLKRDLRPLLEQIKPAVEKYYGTWSVYVCDVTTGSEIMYNNRRAWAASVVKLYVMATVMDAIEKGTLQNSSAVQEDLQEMITVSSNTAWNSLYRRLGGGNYSAGVQKVRAFCLANGYPDSGRISDSPPYNCTSVADTGLFLRRVLAGTNVSPAASQQMLNLMKAQERTWKIPAGVPSDVVTANKTGELFAATPVENDAAIIFAPSGTYILVVLTQNGSVANVKALSSLVYKYMSS